MNRRIIIITPHQKLQQRRRQRRHHRVLSTTFYTKFEIPLLLVLLTIILLNNNNNNHIVVNANCSTCDPCIGRLIQYVQWWVYIWPILYITSAKILCMLFSLKCLYSFVLQIYILFNIILYYITHIIYIKFLYILNIYMQHHTPYHIKVQTQTVANTSNVTMA